MPKAIPSMQALRAFHAVARFGSTIKAAEFLNITPSAISHQLRKLETTIDAQLVRLSGRTIELTSAGQRYALSLTSAMEILGEAAVGLDGTEPSGELKINCSSGLGTFWLSKRLGNFSEQFPQVSINLVNTTEKTDIYGNEASFSIIYGDGVWPEMDVELLYAPRFYPVCSPRLANSMQTLSRPDDISQFRLLHHGGHSDWAAWAAAAGAKKLNTSPGIVFSDINHSLSAAIAGQGIAMGDDVLAEESLANGSLVRPFTKSINGQKSYYIVCSEEKRKRLTCAACIDWIVSEFSKIRVNQEYRAP